MRRLLLMAGLLAMGCVPVLAQPAATVVTTLRSTSTAAGSVKVGCALTGPCTGGLSAGAIDVASVTSAGFVELANNVPVSEVNRLANHAGSLYFNGVALATGASLSGTPGAIPVFTGASTVGDSIMTQSAGTTITVNSILNATTLGGTLSTAVQPNVTTMAGLTTAVNLVTVGTIATGTWSGTIIGLAKGGTNADLSGTGGTSQFLRQNTVGGAITVVRPAVADLSDASNVALLNAANVFSTANTGIFTQAIRATTAGTGTASSLFLGNDAAADIIDIYAFSSTYTPAGPAFANGGWIASQGVGGLGVGAFSGSGSLRFYSGGTTQRWGINAAGDWTFGASAHIADSSGTPVILAGFGTSPTIAGNDYAMTIIVGGSPTTAGIITFGHTWSVKPVCTASSTSHTFFVNASATTTVGVTSSDATNLSTGETVNILCRGY